MQLLEHKKYTFHKCNDSIIAFVYIFTETLNYEKLNKLFA